MTRVRSLGAVSTIRRGQLIPTPSSNAVSR